MSINKYTLFQGNFGLKRMKFSGVANNSISLTTFIPLLTRQNRSDEETVLTQNTFSKFYSYYPQASPFVQISQKTKFFNEIESKDIKNVPFFAIFTKSSSYCSDSAHYLISSKKQYRWVALLRQRHLVKQVHLRRGVKENLAIPIEHGRRHARPAFFTTISIAS